METVIGSLLSNRAPAQLAVPLKHLHNYKSLGWVWKPKQIGIEIESCIRKPVNVDWLKR